LGRELDPERRLERRLDRLGGGDAALHDVGARALPAAVTLSPCG
jgi:hypothetical protein